MISGNGGSGVVLAGGVTTNTVQANLIGLQLDGVSALGNVGDGVLFSGAGANSIGGTVTGAGNVIAFNGGAGVDVASGTGANIRENSIYSNTGLGIDLAPKGVNPNAATNPGTGANNLQNYPVITGVTTTNGTTTVTGTLHSTPSTTFAVEFFANTTADPSGFGQGRSFVGTTTVTTDSSGNATFSAATTTAVTTGQVVSATATDGGGNTSEFSANVGNVPPTADLALILQRTPEPVAVNGLLTYTIGVANGGPNSASNVVVTDTLPAGVTFQSAKASTGSLAQSGTTVTFTVGTLLSGATASFTINVVPTTSGTIANTATATLTETDPTPANDTATVNSTVQQGVDLVVASTVSPNPAIVGTPSAFTFTVTNSSTTTTATNVILTAPLPSFGVTYVSSSSSQGSTATNAGGTGVGAAIGSLAPGASATVTINLTPLGTGTMGLVATAASDQVDSNPANNIASPIITVNAATSTPSTPTGSTGPKVISLNRTGIHGQATEINVGFDTVLTIAPAQTLSNYTLVSAGADGKFNTKDDQKIKLSTADFTTAGNIVTLTTKKFVPLKQKLQLTINGMPAAGLTNTAGAFLAGNGTTSGTNFVEVFTRTGPGNLAQAAAVDEALASGVKVKKASAHKAG